MRKIFLIKISTKNIQQLKFHAVNFMYKKNHRQRPIKKKIDTGKKFDFRKKLPTKKFSIKITSKKFLYKMFRANVSTYN